MSAHGDSHSHGNDSVRFEATDIEARPVVTAVGVLTAFTLVFTFIAWLVFQALAAREQAASAPASPLAAQYAATQPPEPRLQTDPKEDLVKLRAHEAAELGKLGWVDKNAGIVQVPIERAMEMLLAKGLPARQGPVPLSMQPHGVAPSQAAPAAGAPDWQGEHAAGGEAHGEAGSGHAAAEAHGH